MTIMEAAQKWGYTHGTIFNYIKQGRIPCVERIQREKKRWEWFIPDDAEMPMPKKPGPPKAQPAPMHIRTPGEKFPANLSKVPKAEPGQLTREDIADFIAAHAGDMTYAELSAALQLPPIRIQRIYDALHEAYGI